MTCEETARRVAEELLAPQAARLEAEGAVHSYFGDYGEQPGDGTPTVDRATAQRQIVAATVAFLNAL